MGNGSFTPIEYLKDKILFLLLQVSCMILLSGFLYSTGYPLSGCIVILLSWLLILAGCMGYGYISRRRYFQKMEEILQQLDQRYLLGELMPDSYHLEDRMYKELIRCSNKSVIERIRKMEDEQRDYRDYIESWVHEVKAPITSVALMCENHKESLTRRIQQENQKIEDYVDQALYYARSEAVYKDYMIQKTDLSEVAAEVLSKNKYTLIQNQIQAETACQVSVYTDRKWIAFILNQLILNAAKYSREGNAHIWITAADYQRGEDHGVELRVKDNGIGIKPEELGRVCEKGFTGSNGRNHGRATGMGLYLCQKLCHRLGIRMAVESKEGEWTKASLIFPMSTHVRPDDQ